MMDPPHRRRYYDNRRRHHGTGTRILWVVWVALVAFGVMLVSFAYLNLS